MYAARTDWTAERLALIPGAWRDRVAGIYAGKLKYAAALPAGRGLVTDAERAANEWLSETADRMRVLRVPMNLSDGELCELAKRCAADAVDLAALHGGFASASELRRRMAAYVISYGIEPPPSKPVTDTDTGEIVETAITDTGAIKRMSDHVWWRRRLRVVQGRAIEREAIRLGYVHRKAEIYASNASVSRRQAQKRRNRKALENTIATNQHGDEFTLAELAAKAVSNPTIRRGELMTRISGFEAVARGVGHVAAFFTITAPSRMHPKRTAKNGAVLDNPKFDGTTPREAQKYMTGMWARGRAALARAGAAVYGFRIAEPHHDGAPHWHLLLFMAAEVKETVFRILAKYARQADADELTTPQARTARYLVKVIEAGKGTAAGYIAKYVSKNIDGGGYQVQGDIEGGAHDAYTPSHRVETWAAQWGIRQFQQIGGAPVGVWRELRRLKASEQHGATLAAARSAADRGDFAGYLMAMGGPSAKRADRPLAVAYTRPGERYDADRGECFPAPLTRYDEQAPGAVYGVRDAAGGLSFCTRFFQWEVRRKNGKEGFCCSGFDVARAGFGKGAVSVGAVDRSNDLEKAEGVGFEFGRLAGPWTRVNNCTEGIEDGRDFSGESRAGSGGGSSQSSAATYQDHGRAVFQRNHRGAGADCRGAGSAGGS